jgi:quercetin dioxygenase-like cupin family protein
MIKIEKFSSLEEAFDENMDKDLDHVLIRHSYKNGRRILPHSHHDSDEFVIASKGQFRISSEGDEKEFELDGKDVVVIFYPSGKEHALEVLSEKLDYFVMRKHVYVR